MIIDFHTHIFPEKIAKSTLDALSSRSGNVPFTDGTEYGLINELKSANADIAVTLPVLTKPTQFESVFNFAKSINEQFAFTKEKIADSIRRHRSNRPAKRTETVA